MISNFFIVFLFLQHSYATQFNSVEITDVKQIKSICRGISKFEVEPSTFDQVIELSYEKNKVQICSSNASREPGLENYFTNSYFVVASLKNKPQELAYEAEVMPWGMKYDAKKDQILFSFYWPAVGKHKRKVRELAISHCASGCRTIEKCEIERLATDLSEKKLFNFVEQQLLTNESRSNFVMAEGSLKGELSKLDQLFIFALVGNQKAKLLLEQLGEGSDAAWGEVISTYTAYIEDFSKLNCKFSKKSEKVATKN